VDATALRKGNTKILLQKKVKVLEVKSRICEKKLWSIGPVTRHEEKLRGGKWEN